MKRYVIFLLFTILSLSLYASDKIQVTLVKQYHDSGDFVLPKKSIEKKMNCVKIANEKYDFTKQLYKTLTDIQERDEENYVFTVELKYYGKGISIVVNSADILDNDTTKYFGDIMIERKHFALVENENNRELLKKYFKKNSGKTVVFQRLFEKVDYIIPITPTSLDAIYDERAWKVETRQLILNGQNTDKTDLKKPAQLVNDAPEDDDAMKIDVELFDE